MSANANGGVIGAYATESYQASWYLEMLNLVACDPNVRIVNIYHLVDEADLAGWQSGLFYLDHTPKQSAASVHDWIASSAGSCQGAPQPWTPAGVAAAPRPPPAAQPQSPVRILVASDGRVRIFDAVSLRLRRVLAPFGATYTGPLSVAVGGTSAAPLIAAGRGPGRLADGRAAERQDRRAHRAHRAVPRLVPGRGQRRLRSPRRGRRGPDRRRAAPE